MGAALFPAGAHARALDVEALAAQPAREAVIIPGRPYRQHSARRQRGVRSRQPRRAVETAVQAGGERSRAVVHVEQDGVEAARVGAQREADVLDGDAHPRVAQRIPASPPSGSRFQATTSGISSATMTARAAGSRSSAARSVKPMPSPPTSTSVGRRRAGGRSRPRRAILPSRAPGWTSATGRPPRSRIRRRGSSNASPAVGVVACAASPRASLVH